MKTAELLRKAADALEGGRTPLADPFLTENEVSPDQLGSLADQLALGARIVAAGIDKPDTVYGRAMFLVMIEALP